MNQGKSISITSIPTSIFREGEDLGDFLVSHLRENDLENRVIAISSKIVSLAESCVVPRNGITRSELIRAQADRYLTSGGHGTELTIKHGLLIPSAGIDESNAAGGGFILYPRDPYRSAFGIWKLLRERFQVRNLGVVLTDSHSMPLRRGVTGIALAHWGFRATRSLVARPDLFGKPLKFTHVDVADSLASMAVLAMGESDECTPLARIEGVPLEFTETSSASEVAVLPEDDLYYPLLKAFLQDS